MPIEPNDANTPVSAIIPATETISLLEETLRVEKREVLSGIAKVHVTVTERDEIVESLLTRQHVAVDRVAVGTFVSAVPPVRQEGDTVIVPVVEERLVVEKRLFLTEELRIRIGTEQHSETQTVRLRREQADIDLQQPIHHSKQEGTTA